MESRSVQVFCLALAIMAVLAYMAMGGRAPQAETIDASWAHLPFQGLPEK